MRKRKGRTVMFFRTGVCLINFKALQAAAGRRASILKQKSDNSLSGPCVEKTSRCASFEKEGSLTVEAALVFPLFLFTLTAFLYLFLLIQLRAEIGRALTDTGREVSSSVFFRGCRRSGAFGSGWPLRAEPGERVPGRTSVSTDYKGREGRHFVSGNSLE